MTELTAELIYQLGWALEPLRSFFTDIVHIALYVGTLPTVFFIGIKVFKRFTK